MEGCAAGYMSSLRVTFRKSTNRWRESTRLSIMPRRLVQFITALSLLLCAATVALWIGTRNLGEDFFLVTGRGTVWNFTSSGGVLGVTRYSRWPGPVHSFHRVWDGDVSHLVTPVFAIRWAGANRTEWEKGKFHFAHGTVCLLLVPDGTVSYGRLALPAIQQFAMQKFSAPFPFWTIGIPCWLAVVIFAFLPMLLICRSATRRFRGRLRTSRGRCYKCGYNLTGNASGLCPECGSKISS